MNNEYSLEDRVAALEETQRILDEDMAPVDQRHKILREARFQALWSLTQEIGEHLGIDGERFLQHFEGRVRFYQDRNLQIAENISPSLAAQIDGRDPNEVPTEEFPPPLFPKSEQS